MKLGLTLAAIAAASLLGSQPTPPAIDLFFTAAGRDTARADAALASLREAWRPGYTPMMVDLLRMMVAPPDAERPIESPAVGRLVRFLERQTGQRFGVDLARWREFMWKQPYDPHPEYGQFKSRLYALIDPRMAHFFRGPSRIRLDQIEWGGVGVNGIPPLRSPKVVASSAATWLSDSHVVFGITVAGEARAYPRRILAWHEMALDRLGGVEVTVVYCTLCGTVIPYQSVVGGTHRTFGTSGLLYRSNKLMFDEETNTLWSTLDGGPVVGPLAESKLQLEPLPVVTTSWGEWRRLHPHTTVLSAETGFERDYSEGAAYRDYFATDQLMFQVPIRDRRLANKAEIVGLFLPAAGGGRQAVALSASLLNRDRLFQATVDGASFVVLTSPEGANRVYDAGVHQFVRLEQDGRLRDAAGQPWNVTEDALTMVTPPQRLQRRVAFRAFWFGWVAQFPDTLLFK